MSLRLVNILQREYATGKCNFVKLELINQEHVITQHEPGKRNIHDFGADHRILADNASFRRVEFPVFNLQSPILKCELYRHGT